MADRNIQIKITTTADLAGSKEVQKHLEQLKDLGAKVDKVGEKVGVAGDSFSIFGERRAALHLGEIAEDFVRGGNAADVLANSIFRAEYALGRTFIPLLVVAGVYNLYKGLKQSADEAEKVREQIDQLSLPQDAFAGVAALSDHLKAIVPELQRIRAEAQGGTIPSIGEFANALFQGANPFEERNRQLRELLAGAKGEAQSLVQQYQIAAGIQKEMVEGSEKFAGSTEEAVELDQAHLDTLLKQAAIFEQFKDPSLFAERDKALAAEADRY